MRKFLFIISILAMTGCNHSQEEIDNLNHMYDTLSSQVSGLNSRQESLLADISRLEKEKSDLKTETYHFRTGTDPEYFIVLEIKQSTFTLNPSEHIKNHMNRMQISVPISEKYYNEILVGTDLSEEMKIGSLIFNGDASWLKIKVINKYIK